MSKIERIEEMQEIIESDTATVFEKIEAEQVLDRLLGGTGTSGLSAKPVQKDNQNLSGERIVKNETSYEWCVEILDKPYTHEDGSVTIDIVDHYHCDKLEEAVYYVEELAHCRCCVTLVKDVGNKEDGLLLRDWFHVGRNGIIEEDCPKRFIKELAAKNRLGRLNASPVFMSHEEYCEIQEEAEA